MSLFQTGEFFRYYFKAVTRYQLHSPFVFELSTVLLEDPRWFYAFRDVEELRIMLRKAPHLVGNEQVPGHLLKTAGNRCQGQLLFRLVEHLRPQTMLELGSTVGIRAMYMAAASREARFIGLETNPQSAHIARTNLDWLGLAKNAVIVDGAMDVSLPSALDMLKVLDILVLSLLENTVSVLRIWETSLPFAHDKTIFVFSHAHHSKESAATWAAIKNHPRVRLSLDYFDLSIAFIDPDFREKQHFCIIPYLWKPWRFF